MDKLDQKFNEIRQFCKQNANPDVVKKYSKFFTEGYDAYGLTQEIFETQRDKFLQLWKDEMSIDDYLQLGDKLVSTGKYEEASFAVTFLYKNLENLNVTYFEKIGLWLENGIANWGHTDVLSGRVLSHFTNNKIVEIEVFNKWVKSDSIWKKRAVAVTLIEALKTDISLKRILNIINPLMTDPAKKVQQGLGWLLRETWKLHPAETEDFLIKWKDTCGRTIIQYATEKMDKDYRLKFRKTKK
jgi:3-methyladenine DNA glycosylase AlkD